MTATRLQGRLNVRQHGETDDALFVGEMVEPFAEWMKQFNGRQVSVRYWILGDWPTDERCTDVEIMTALGECDAEYLERYSDYTGYLWTDENAMVGGHDLVGELRNHIRKDVDRFARIEITT